MTVSSMCVVLNLLGLNGRGRERGYSALAWLSARCVGRYKYTAHNDVAQLRFRPNFLEFFKQRKGRRRQFLSEEVHHCFTEFRVYRRV